MSNGRGTSSGGWPRPYAPIDRLGRTGGAKVGSQSSSSHLDGRDNMPSHQERGERRGARDGDSGAFFERFLEILLPDDTHGLLVVIEAYFDESMRNSGVFAVAGYGFLPEQARNFSRDWREMLGPIKVFRMADLAALQGEFKSFSRSESDDLIKRAVELIRHYIAVAVGFSCNLEDFRKIAIELRGLREPYSYLCHLCMQEVGNWLRDKKEERGAVYAFEAGHEFQNESSNLMNLATRVPTIGELYCYRSHGFVSKTDALPLHAADFLAWEWTKYQDETVARQLRPARRSLIAAWDDERYRLRHLSEDKLREVYEPMRQMLNLDGIAEGWRSCSGHRS